MWLRSESDLLSIDMSRIRIRVWRYGILVIFGLICLNLWRSNYQTAEIKSTIGYHINSVKSHTATVQRQVHILEHGGVDIKNMRMKDLTLKYTTSHTDVGIQYKKEIYSNQRDKYTPSILKANVMKTNNKDIDPNQRVKNTPLIRQQLRTDRIREYTKRYIQKRTLQGSGEIRLDIHINNITQRGEGRNNMCVIVRVPSVNISSVRLELGEDVGDDLSILPSMLGAEINGSMERTDSDRTDSDRTDSDGTDSDGKDSDRTDSDGTDSDQQQNSLTAPRFHDAYRNPCWHEVDGESVYVRCLPYFFVAGFTKCGTSELFDILKLHPHISPANLKEPFWWIKQHITKVGGAREYSEYFSKATYDILATVRPAASVLGWQHPVVTYEATPDLLYASTSLSKPWKVVTEPDTILMETIRTMLPEAKIIVIMRNPTERAFSDYTHFDGRSLDDFHKASTQAIMDFRACVDEAGLRACAYKETHMAQTRIRAGLYHVFMDDLLNTFPRHQILYIRLEDYKEHKLTWIRKIIQFLQLDKMSEQVEETMLAHHNPNPSNYRLGDMRRDTRQILDDFYAPHNRALATLLEDDAFLYSAKRE